MALQTISVKEYLIKKGVVFREHNSELICACLFNHCDEDSRKDEGHLYFNATTGQYQCKKCGEQGNIVTLAKFLGDSIKNIAITDSVLTEPATVSALKDKPVIKLDPTQVGQYHQALPERIREYLNNRGIPDDIINDFQLGWGKFFGKNWITFPVNNKDGECQYFKLRQDPDEGKKKMTSGKGIEAELYPWNILKQAQVNSDFIVIAEGECDTLLLISKGIPAVTSTHGAGTFKQTWAAEFTKFEKIYACFDRDKAGEQGAKHAIELLQAAGCKSVFRIELPEELGSGGDITDYFTKNNGNLDDFFGLAKLVPNPNAPVRVKQVPQPNQRVNFELWHNAIMDNFPDLAFAAEVSLSIIAQLLINDITNPFALVLVDVPSSGKTITINFFDGIESLTYSTDKFSPSAFLSSAANVAKEKLGQIDMLPRIRYKMFLIRDFATIFAKREEDLNEILGLLTRVLDGEGLSLDSGVHGQREYRGDFLFMMLAASTPIPPRVSKMMGNLGSRLFFLNMHTRNKTDGELISQLARSTAKEKELVCKSITKDLLYTLWSTYPQGVDWDRTKDDPKLIQVIVHCANLLARLRGVINVWRDRSSDGQEYDFTVPVVEKPDRILQAFYNLARGHAMAQGRTQIDLSDLKPVIEICFDSATSIRSKLFRALIDHKGSMATSEVMATLNCSRPTALKEMTALEVLGVCNLTTGLSTGVGEPEKLTSVIADFDWFFGEECSTIRGLT